MHSDLPAKNISPVPVEKKLKKPKQERVPLSKSSSEICKEAIKTLNDKYPGIKIDKKQLVNWVIESYFQKLSPSHEKALYSRFYDEELFLAQALKELRKLKKNGENFDLTKILKGPKFSNEKRNASSKKLRFEDKSSA